MVDLITIAALGLALAGVIGAVAPLVPGPLLALSGVLLYWWSTGYADPGPVLLAGFVLVALLAVAADLLGGAVGATAGGAGYLAAAAGGAVGLLLIPVVGPLGVLLGVAGVTFLLVVRDEDVETGVRAALGATVGLLASAFVQLVLTAGMAIALLVVVIL
ncbi:MAG: DUF456 family protein [Halobacteriaceae archaeon]